PGVYTPASVSGAVASDWFQIDPVTGAVNSGSHPDFSASGSVIQFGVVGAASFSSTGHPAGTIDIRFDNLSIDIHSVPEPSSLVLAAAGLLGFVVFARRRKIAIATLALLAAAGALAAGDARADVVYAWGYGGFGAVGDGTPNGSLTPIAVSVLTS